MNDSSKLACPIPGAEPDPSEVRLTEMTKAGG
jgi:hypothetical protein